MQDFGGCEEDAAACPAPCHRLVSPIAQPYHLLRRTLLVIFGAISRVCTVPAVVLRLDGQTLCRQDVGELKNNHKEMQS